MKRILSIDPLLLHVKVGASHHPGRKSKKDAHIRKLFYTCGEFKTSPPKKEYLRCKLIRGFKRAIRQIRKNVLPSKTLNRIRGNPYNALRVWQALAGCYEKYMTVLEPLSCTEKGPKTDGKLKKRIRGRYLEKSFNSTFCIEFFSHIGVRESFYYYVEFLFADLNPEVLCDKFDFMCCKGFHSPECVEKWLLIKKYMNCYMIQDLGLEPWFPQNHSNSFLPSIFTVRLDNCVDVGMEKREMVTEAVAKENKEEIWITGDLDSSFKFRFDCVQLKAL
ncbi:unnamed protein product [Blepharisma stoltei]|uniref:Uncharacterized protein n=1 Tax=Blepharisma stoltei TaxID=1481888 RepID=A0AAU9K3P2_9CILI|nr:unnamed protein product [Blepharisma stoltei]